MGAESRFLLVYTNFILDNKLTYFIFRATRIADLTECEALTDPRFQFWFPYSPFIHPSGYLSALGAARPACLRPLQHRVS